MEGAKNVSCAGEACADVDNTACCVSQTPEIDLLSLDSWKLLFIGCVLLLLHYATKRPPPQVPESEQRIVENAESRPLDEADALRELLEDTKNQAEKLKAERLKIRQQRLEQGAAQPAQRSPAPAWLKQLVRTNGVMPAFLSVIAAIQGAMGGGAWMVPAVLAILAATYQRQVPSDPFGMANKRGGRRGM